MNCNCKEYLSEPIKILILNLSMTIFILFLCFINPIDQIKGYAINRQQGESNGFIYLFGDKIIEQSFVCESDADSFEIKISNPSSYHGSFNVKLIENQTETIQTWTIEKLDLFEPWISFKLRNNILTAGKLYTIYISAPELNESNCISIIYAYNETQERGVMEGTLDNSHLIVDGQEIAGTLCFSTYKESLNVFFILAIFVLYLVTNTWWINRKKRIDSYCVWLLLGFGIIMMLIMSPASGPDEAYHYYSSFELSNVIMGRQNIGLVDEQYRHKFTDHYNNNEDFQKVLDDIMSKQEHTEEVFQYDKHVSKLFMPASHIFPAIGITLARLIKLNYSQLYMLARFINMLAYAVLCTFAIRIIPKKKELILLLAISPMAVHQAAQLSYDMLINAFSLLFSAYILRVIHIKNRFSWKDVLICCLFTIVVGSIKVIYCILLLLILAIPVDSYKSKRDRLIKLTSLFFLAILSILLIEIEDIMPKILGSGKRIITDQYSFSFVIQYPLRFIRYVFLTIQDNLARYIKEAFGVSLGGLNVPIPESVVVLYIFVVILVSMSKIQDDIILSTKQHAVFLITAVIGIFFTICTCLSFTIYGFQRIGGVQGRYFIPFLAPLFFAIGNRHIYIESKKRIILCLIPFVWATNIVLVMSQII